MSHVPYPRPAGDFRETYRADMTLYRTDAAWYAAVAMVLFALTIPAWGSPYLLSQMILIGIYGIAALGLNVLVGYTGQISLGHGAFFGFGAFSSAFLSANGVYLPIGVAVQGSGLDVTWLQILGPVPVLVAIPIAGFMTAAVGLLFGSPAARLKGLYLAIATLASQFILQDFFNRAESFTGGPWGSLADRPSIFGYTLNTDGSYFYLVLFWLLVSCVMVSNLMRSRDGRALVAVRDHYLSAEIMGINLTKYRILSFGISSFFAGLAGALFGHYLEFVTAEGFTILLSIQFLAMIIIGGLGSVAGSVLGAAFILLLPQVMEMLAGGMADIFPAMARGTAYIKEMSVGAAIILFLVFEPEGLIHRWRLIRASFKLFPFSH